MAQGGLGRQKSRPPRFAAFAAPRLPVPQTPIEEPEQVQQPQQDPASASQEGTEDRETDKAEHTQGNTHDGGDGSDNEPTDMATADNQCVETAASLFGGGGASAMFDQDEKSANDEIGDFAGFGQENPQN